MSSTWLLVGIILACQIGLAGLIYGIAQLRRRARSAAGEAERLQSLLDILDESIVVCSGLRIVAANRSFATLVGLDKDDVGDLFVNEFIADVSAVGRLLESGDSKIETEIITKSGDRIAVEASARSIYQAGVHQRLLEIRDIRDRREWQHQIAFLAHHDPLTKLPNRALLNERLEAAVARSKESGGCCAVIWVDLDHFKKINDTFGHDTGDNVLGMIAERLRMELPRDALITRVGGDEFVILLESIPDALEARLVAQQLRRLLNQPLPYENRTVTVGASIGVAVCPDDSDTVDGLLRNADLALYQAKAQGRGRSRNYTAELGHAQERRFSLSSDLPQAFEQGQIQAFFQPVVSNRTGKLKGFEALARWHHPKFGFVPPPEFVRLAEEQGEIARLTETMILAAIDAASDYPDDVQFAVNVTPNQLNADLVDLVRDLIRQTGFNPQRLEIEVTEDALINDFEHTSQMFSRLRSLGVQIAMDDFGAGFTSLNNLRSLTFDRIKIDRVFTTSLPLDRRSAAIIKSMMVLARELDIATTIEGVETEDQLDFLNVEECGELQGYLFSPPLPAAALKDLTIVSPRRNESKNGSLLLPARPSLALPAKTQLSKPALVPAAKAGAPLTLTASA